MCNFDLKFVNMSVLDLARVIIYRFHEKGLEIFLINNEMEKDSDIWKLPEGLSNTLRNDGKLSVIDLESVVDDLLSGVCLSMILNFLSLLSKKTYPAVKKEHILRLKKHLKKYYLMNTRQ